jgi:MFS family permease
MFSNFTLLTLTTLSSALLLGGLLTLLFGNLTRVVRDQFGLSDRGEASLGAAYLVSLMVFLFVGGLLADQWGLKGALVTGSALAAFSVASLAMSKGFSGAVFFSGLLGAATGVLHTATTAAMPLAFFNLDLAAAATDIRALGDVPAATCLGYVFVALGGLLIPFLVTFLVKRFSFRHGLLVLALLAVCPAALATMTAGIDSEPERHLDILSLFGDLRFWLALVAIFFFYGVETSALRWAPNYLCDIGLSERARLAMVIAFWCIFLAARLACAGVTSVTAFTWLLLVLVLLATTLIGNMMGMYRGRAGAYSFLLLAGCLGPVFPILAGLVLVSFPGQPAVAIGVLSALGTTGRLVAGPVTDRLLASGKVRAAMAVCTVMGVVVIFPPLIWLMPV